MSTPTPAEPGPEAVEPEAVQTAEPESVVEEMPRPRGRTVKIMAAAVAIGILGGAGTGYAVQAARKPTPLPPLAVTQPTYPAEHRAVPVLSAADDDMVRTDGDLTKLLIPAPAGTKPWDSPRGDSAGWYSLYDLASAYTQPGREMSYQLTNGFRRAAVRTWMDGNASYELDLVQYRHARENMAGAFVADLGQRAWTDTDATPVQLPDSDAAGGVYAGSKKLYDDSGYSNGYYRGYALARHGDIAVLIFVYSPDRISSGPLMTLLQNQLERL